jgi:hypothetical protein
MLVIQQAAKQVMLGLLDFIHDRLKCCSFIPLASRWYAPTDLIVAGNQKDLNGRICDGIEAKIQRRNLTTSSSVEKENVRQD